MRITKLKNAGDTIIEVMVVLTLLGLALGIGYATANRSLQNTRTAQENAEATAILQAQLETLRYLTPTLNAAPGGLGSLPSNFCINPTATNPDASDIVTGASCDKFGQNKLFSVDISYDGAAGNESFTLVATWDDTNAAAGKDTVTFRYRTYQ